MLANGRWDLIRRLRGSEKPVHFVGPYYANISRCTVHRTSKILIYVRSSHHFHDKPHVRALKYIIITPNIQQLNSTRSAECKYSTPSALRADVFLCAFGMHYWVRTQFVLFSLYSFRNSGWNTEYQNPEGRSACGQAWIRFS